MDVSVVVVAYDMGRELPRTLRSLDVGYQRGIGADDYEVVVVDNGSPVPVAAEVIDSFQGRCRVERIDDAPASPARAANTGVAMADGDLVGLVVDGARLASPGLLSAARAAAGLVERPVITAPGYHLGSTPHMRAHEAGYDEQVEDGLLAEIGWEADGYQLFAHSVLGGSSSRGWFGPMGESSSLFMPAGLWVELGGLDESFVLPGGGLVNHDLYRRACGSEAVDLLYLLGEGTFHQIHGGAATSRRFTWDAMHADYQAIRGIRYEPPPNDPLHVGRVPSTALAHLEHSVAWLAQRRQPGR